MAGAGCFHFAPRRHWVNSWLELCGPCRRRRCRCSHRIPAAAPRAVFHLDSHHLRCPRRHRLGALPLALVHPMSDSDSRTEKRKVNTPRLPGRRLGMDRRQAPQPPLRLHLSLCRTCGWRCWFVPRGARLQEANAGSRVEVSACQGTSGEGSWAQKLRALSRRPGWAGMPHEGPLRHLSRARRAHDLGLERRSRFVVPVVRPAGKRRGDPDGPGEVAAQ